MKKTSKRVLLVAACLLVAGVAHAQSAPAYPARPVRMVVPFAPGGASDFVGRLIQPRFVQELGQQVVIDNRAGASGNIGVEVAARATPAAFAVFMKEQNERFAQVVQQIGGITE